MGLLCGFRALLNACVCIMIVVRVILTCHRRRDSPTNDDHSPVASQPWEIFLCKAQC